MAGRLLVAGMIVACLLAAGCAGQPGGGADPVGGGVVDAAEYYPTGGEVDPVDLVGSWTVVETAGDDHIVRLEMDLRVWLDCGTVSGAWRADQSGLFVAYASGASGGCVPIGGAAPAWLTSATSFEVDGEDRVLRDSQGNLIARLLPGAEPTAGPDLAPSLAEPPVVTDELRQALAPAAPVPAGLVPAGPEVLAGRWVPAEGPDGPAHVVLEADGGWHGSDGCNGEAGRWIAGAGGALLAVSGPTTLVFCDNVPVGGWLSAASRAALDGETLVLLDAQGQQTGRLVRD